MHDLYSVAVKLQVSTGQYSHPVFSHFLLAMRNEKHVRALSKDTRDDDIISTLVL